MFFPENLLCAEILGCEGMQQVSPLSTPTKKVAVLVSLALLATPAFGEGYSKGPTREVNQAGEPATNRPFKALNRTRQNVARAGGGGNNAAGFKGAADASRKQLAQLPSEQSSESLTLVADSRAAEFDKTQKQLDIEQRNLDRRLAQAQKVREQGEKKGNSALSANADRMEKSAIEHYEKRVEQIVGKLGENDSPENSAPFSGSESAPLSDSNSVPFMGNGSVPFNGNERAMEELVPLTRADGSSITPIPERSVVKPSTTPRETSQEPARPWWKPKKTDRP